MGVPGSGSRSALLTDWVLSGIRAGSLRPNEKLPSEEMLARNLGTSRATVREGLTELERSGFVVRRHGSGTYIAPRSVIASSRIDQLSTFIEVIQHAGYEPDITGWSVSVVEPPADVAAALELHRVEKALLVKRIYLAGRLRVAYCEGYVPAVWAGRDVVLSAPGELRWQLEDLLRVRVTHQVTSLSAVGAPEAVADALMVPQGTPILRSNDLSLVDGGPPLLYGLNYYDTTIVRPTMVRLPRSPSSGSGDRGALTWSSVPGRSAGT